MRLLAPVVAVALLGVAATTGCGRTGAVSGLSPAQAVQEAATKFGGQSLKFDLTGKITVDSSKVRGDAQSLDQLKSLGSGVTLSGHGEEENPQRVELVMTVNPGLDKPATVIGYDGNAYVALDGTHFADAGSVRAVTGGFGVTPGDVSNYLSNLGNVQDKGAEKMDGLDTEHYQVALDQSFLSKALSQASQGQSPNPFAGFIEQLIQFTGGTIDAWVNQADGSLDRTRIAVALGFDLDKLGQVFGGLGQGSSTPSGGTPGGSLGISLNVDLHPHDYGASVSITKPTVDPNAPKLPGGLNLFGQGA